ARGARAGQHSSAAARRGGGPELRRSLTLAAQGHVMRAVTGVIVALAPSPSWPDAAEPQHAAVPSLFTTHVWFGPTARSTTSVTAGTGTGLVRWLNVPSPICPAPLLPQHAIVPSALRAQAPSSFWFPVGRIASCTMPLRPTIGDGDGTARLTCWMPSWPTLLRPQ